MTARGAIRGPGNWRPRRPNPALSSGMPPTEKASSGASLASSTYPISLSVAGNVPFNADWGTTDVRDAKPSKKQELSENKPVVSNDGTHKNNGSVNPAVHSNNATDPSKQPVVEKESVGIKLDSNTPAPGTVNKAKPTAPDPQVLYSFLTMTARGAIRGPGNWRPRRPNPALSSGMPSTEKASSGASLASSAYPISSSVAGNAPFNADWGTTDVRDVVKKPSKNQELAENKPVVSNAGTHKNNGSVSPVVHSNNATDPSKQPVVEKESVGIKLDSNAPAPVTVNKAKPTAPVSEMEAANPGWDGIDISHLITRRTNKKEVPTAKVDTKTSAAVNTMNAKQSAQVAPKTTEPLKPEVNILDVTHIKRGASNQEPAIAENGANIATAVSKQSATISEMEAANPGWDGIDISHLITRRTNKKDVPTAKVDTKTSAAVNTVNAKQSAQAAQEVDDPHNPGWETIDIRHILERKKRNMLKSGTKPTASGGKVIRPSVDSGVASVYDKAEMKQTAQKESETEFKSEDVFTRQDQGKDLSKINNAGSASAMSEKADVKGDVQLTRTISVTQDEVIEFHTLTKECSEAFGNISKFLLKLGSRC